MFILTFPSPVTLVNDQSAKQTFSSFDFSILSEHSISEHICEEHPLSRHQRFLFQLSLAYMNNTVFNPTWLAFDDDLQSAALWPNFCHLLHLPQNWKNAFP